MAEPLYPVRTPGWVIAVFVATITIAIGFGTELAGLGRPRSPSEWLACLMLPGLIVLGHAAAPSSPSRQGPTP